MYQINTLHTTTIYNVIFRLKEIRGQISKSGDQCPRMKGLEWHWLSSVGNKGMWGQESLRAFIRLWWPVKEIQGEAVGKIAIYRKGERYRKRGHKVTWCQYRWMKKAHWDQPGRTWPGTGCGTEVRGPWIRGPRASMWSSYYFKNWNSWQYWENETLNFHIKTWISGFFLKVTRPYDTESSLLPATKCWS